jgi:tryptophan synthase alpha chain
MSQALSRITSRFNELRTRGRKAFIPYLTAGDPDLETTARLILELERRGADLVELGVPFSDPMADGPVIQRASDRALRRSIGVRDCLGVVRAVREHSDIPIILFGYLNPFIAIGLDRLPEELLRAGVDGVLATDLVPEESEEFVGKLRPAGIDTIFLAAPTSTDARLQMIAEATTGFVYVISRTGVTGVRDSLSEAVSRLTRRVRGFTDLPIAVGFGVSTPEHAAEVWRTADAVVVGSRIVAEIESHLGDPDLVDRVGDLAAWLVSSRKAS